MTGGEIAILIVILVQAVLIAYFGVRFKEAKEAQIASLREQIATLERLTAPELLDYLQRVKDQQAEVIRDLKSDLDNASREIEEGRDAKATLQTLFRDMESRREEARKSIEVLQKQLTEEVERVRQKRRDEE